VKIFNEHSSTKYQSDLEVTSAASGMQLSGMQSHEIKSEAFVSVYIETLYVDELCVWSDIKSDPEQTARRIKRSCHREVIKCQEKWRESRPWAVWIVYLVI